MSATQTAFDGLPAVVYALLPEIRSAEWPAEQHADCAHCPMSSGHFAPWHFDPVSRCCTAQPSIVNWLVGRALRRGGASRDLILKRLEDPEGVTAWGIDPQPHLDARFNEDAKTGFGRDQTLRCPYWVGGDLSCGIWHDRSSTCRTWYCKHEHGLAGAVSWSRMHQTLYEVESRLALWAINRGDPPDDGEAVAPAVWATWYERASLLVEAARPEDVAHLAGGLTRLRAEVGLFVDVGRLRKKRGLPDVLVPAISEMTRTGDDVLLTGYSSFDAIRVPKAIFALLANLDGRTWREAIVDTANELDEQGIAHEWMNEALIVELHRVEAIRDPDGADDLPYGVEMADMEAWARAAPKP